MKPWIVLAGLSAALLAGCGANVNRTQAVYILVDTSGTYAKEVTKAQSVVNYVLGTLQPGDSLAVGRVKSRSFTEKDIVAKVTLNRDPIQANGQKRIFGGQIATFAKSSQAGGGSRYTDITGGMMQGAEFLHETGARTKTLIIFSDMQEELDYKTKRDFPIKLEGIRIIALNVTKLDTDNVDPRRYTGRLEWWEQRAREAGASDWRVVNDLEHLERVFANRG
jgi:hypothetical protein